jgi:D-3-phosphoglycerate dehydrogenase
VTLIFSTHPLHPEVTDDLRALGKLRVATAPTQDAIDAESAGAGIIIVRAPIAPGIITRETGLRACVRHGAGLDMIPVDVATDAGVLVANVPGANALTVAEHAIWSALALLRRFPAVDRDLRRAGWEAGRVHSNAGRELSGRTLGLLGAGNIGTATARIARGGFGMRVVAHTRSPDKLPDGIEAVTFDGLLAEADVLVLCCPLNDTTRGIIDARALCLMKPGAILINVSRGPVVVEAALIEALQSRHLAGAAIDVFDTQPLPSGHAFLALENVILTPHMAGITEESMLRMGQGVVRAIRQIVAGELPDTLVNPEAVAAYRKRF